MNSIENRVKANLLAARKQSKLKQSDVAEMLGVSVQSVWTWENGRQFPGLDKLEKLANLLGLGDGTWFVEDHGNAPPAENGDTVQVSREIWKVCVPLYQAYSQINPTAPRLPASLKLCENFQTALPVAGLGPIVDLAFLAQFDKLARTA